MSAANELKAEIRSGLGKAASRRLRRLENKVPAVMYGSEKECQNLILNVNELTKAMQSETFYSQIHNVSIDGEIQQAIVRDIHRSPDSGKVLHMDFLRISADKELNVSLPLHFLNEEACVGVKVGGGQITHNLVEVEISCLPANLPEFIEVDVVNLEVGSSLYLSDLIMPDKVVLSALTSDDSEDRDIAVVTVAVRRGASDDDFDAVAEETTVEGDSAESGDSEGPED